MKREIRDPKNILRHVRAGWTPVVMSLEYGAISELRRGQERKRVNQLAVWSLFDAGYLTFVERGRFRSGTVTFVPVEPVIALLALLACDPAGCVALLRRALEAHP